MKKYLFSVSLAALAICSTLQEVHGMEVEHEAVTLKRVREDYQEKKGDHKRLKSLSVVENPEVTPESLAQYANLEHLTLSYGDVVWKDLDWNEVASLGNIEGSAQYEDQSIVHYTSKDYSNCLDLPHLKKIQYKAIHEGDHWEIEKQQLIYMAEKLFLDIEKDEGKCRNPEYKEIKKDYEKTVVIPNYLNLGRLHRSSTYPLKPEDKRYAAVGLFSIIEAQKKNINKEQYDLYKSKFKEYTGFDVNDIHTFKKQIKADPVQRKDYRDNYYFYKADNSFYLENLFKLFENKVFFDAEIGDFDYGLNDEYNQKISAILQKLIQISGKNIEIDLGQTS